jgi:hypothetical protein
MPQSAPNMTSPTRRVQQLLTIFRHAITTQNYENPVLVKWLRENDPSFKSIAWCLSAVTNTNRIRGRKNFNQNTLVEFPQG